jgi:hypothetical protein
MSRLKFKQILSSISYDATNNRLHVSGSTQPSLVLSGSLLVTSSSAITGSITVVGIDTWGDSGSFDTVDLGNNSF